MAAFGTPVLPGTSDMTNYRNTKVKSAGAGRIFMMRLIAWPVGATGAAGLGRICLDGAPSTPDGSALIFAAMCFVPIVMIGIHALLPSIGKLARHLMQTLGRTTSGREVQDDALPEPY